VAGQIARRAGRRAAGKTAVQIIKAVNPAEAVREICTAYCDYRKVVEQERSKRRDIAARKAVDLAAIRAKRDVLLRYLDRTFDERRRNFGRLFEKLDVLIRDGRTDAMAPVLEAVVALAQHSPFRTLSSVEGVRAFLADPDAKTEL
jgi:hypothetical protein